MGTLNMLADYIVNFRIITSAEHLKQA